MLEKALLLSAKLGFSLPVAPRPEEDDELGPGPLFIPAMSSSSFVS
jgi:hypothetical protein